MNRRKDVCFFPPGFFWFLVTHNSLIALSSVSKEGKKKKRKFTHTKERKKETKTNDGPFCLFGSAPLCSQSLLSLELSNSTLGIPILLLYILLVNFCDICFLIAYLDICSASFHLSKLITTVFQPNRMFCHCPPFIHISLYFLFKYSM